MMMHLVRCIAIAEPWSLGALEPKGAPIYAHRLTSYKYLISSMKHLKPATAVSCACVGIRRMEAELPLPLGKRAGRGTGHGCGLCCNSFRAVALAVGAKPQWAQECCIFFKDDGISKFCTILNL